MQLLMTPEDVESHKDDWLADRAKRVSASEISAVVGRQPEQYATRFSLWWDKRAKRVEDPEEETEAQARGRHLEPYVLERWAAEHDHGLDIRTGGYYRADLEEWQAGTFDALGFADPFTPAVPIEIKTVHTPYAADGTRMWGDAGTAEIPPHYLCQVYQQMDVAGADTAYVVALFMQSWKLREYVINRTKDVEADMSYLRQEGSGFMFSLLADVPPDPLWQPGPATMRTLKWLYRPLDPDASVRIPNALANRRLKLKATIKDSETKLAAVDVEIRHRMGTAKRAVALDTDGELRTVVTRSISDRKGYTVEPTEVDSLRPGTYGKGE